MSSGRQRETGEPFESLIRTNCKHSVAAGKRFAFDAGVDDQGFKSE
jgi:hypothetical protein